MPDLPIIAAENRGLQKAVDKIDDEIALLELLMRTLGDCDVSRAYNMAKHSLRKVKEEIIKEAQ